MMKRKMVKKMTSEGTPLPAALKVVGLSSSSCCYKPKGTRTEMAVPPIVVDEMWTALSQEGRTELGEEVVVTKLDRLGL